MTTPREVPVRPHYRTVGAAGGDDIGAAAAPPPAEGGGGGWLTQRLGPLPAWGWIAVVALAAVGFILWRRSTSGTGTTTTGQSASTGTTATPSTATTAADNCSDAAGNAVPCSQADYSSQIAALQAEIDNLQGVPSVPTGATTGSSTGTTMDVTVPQVTGESVTQARAILQAMGLSATTSGSGSTVSGQVPAAGAVAQVGTPVTLTVTSSAATAGTTTAA